MLFLALLIAGSAHAEVASITCQCGHSQVMPGQTAPTWFHKGDVTFRSEVNDESYWLIGQRLCRQKFHSLQIEVAGCDYSGN